MENQARRPGRRARLSPPRWASAAATCMLAVALAWAGASLAVRPARAAECAATASSIPWPVPDWTVTEVPEGSFAELAAYAFPSGLDEEKREGIRTNALIVVRDGRILFERYARGFDAGTPHIAWSVSKTVTGTLIARAFQDGLLSDIDQPAGRFYPPLAEGPKAAMTVRDLLFMSSGLDYEESYEFAPLWSDVVAMLYTRGSADMAAYTAARPLAAPPGKRWSYTSGDSVLLAAVLRGIVGEAAYPDYPWTALFDPLGMSGAVFERDRAGTFIGSSNLYLRTRDLARIGLLWAMDGCWNGRRLLPEGWAELAAETAPALLSGDGSGWRSDYGAQWWLNKALPGTTRRMLPSAPDDALIGSGHWGQYLVVLPRQGLVIARNGDDRDGSFSLDRLVALALGSSGSLP